MVEGDRGKRARAANLKAVLGAGGGLHQVVKTTVFMTDLGEFAPMSRCMRPTS
jgi:enamine deaminase RidA (YjgF/YER057c/UK114 family)